MRTVALTNQKGGVGKTTSGVNLAAALSGCGQRVLLVDLDPSGQASQHVGLRVNEEASPVWRVLARGDAIEANVVATGGGFELLAGGDDVAEAESLMTGAVRGRGRYVLREALEEVTPGRWDLVLIDCAPTLGQLVASALIAAQGVLIPIALEAMPLDGFEKLMRVLTNTQKYENAALQVDGIFVTKTNERTNLAHLVRAELQQRWPAALLDCSIRINTDLAAAFWAGKTVFSHAPRSNGAADYRALADELLKRGIHR